MNIKSVVNDFLLLFIETQTIRLCHFGQVTTQRTRRSCSSAKTSVQTLPTETTNHTFGWTPYLTFYILMFMKWRHQNQVQVTVHMIKPVHVIKQIHVIKPINKHRLLDFVVPQTRWKCLCLLSLYSSIVFFE